MNQLEIFQIALEFLDLVEIRNAHIFVYEPEGNIPLWKFTCRCEDNIKMDL
jgi:hypothetical protein